MPLKNQTTASIFFSHQTTTECPCLTFPDPSTPPMLVAGCFNCPVLAPTFGPPITCSKATVKLPTPSCPRTLESASVIPLWKVVGVEDLVREHISLSLSELSQIESKLGPYTSNAFTLFKEFQYISQSYI